MAFNPLTQIKALFGLPKQLQRTAEAQRQFQQMPQLPPISPPVSQPVPSITQPLQQQTQQLAQPAESPQNAQIGAITKALGGIEQGLKALQKTTAQPVVTPAEERLRGIEERLAQSSQISPEEEETQRQLNALISSRELGLRDIEEKPIAMPFITGQKTALERRAATQAVPLTQKLGLLQSKRQAALDVAQTRLGIEKERAKRARPDEEKVTEYTNSEGNRVVVYRDRRTGKVREEILGAVQREPTPTTGSERKRDRAIKVINLIESGIDKFRKPDGTLPLVVFIRARESYAKAMGDTNEFDDIYLSQLSPEDRARFKGKSTSGTTESGGVVNPFK